MPPGGYADGIILEKIETRQKYSKQSAAVNTSHRKKALVRQPGNRLLQAGVVNVDDLQAAAGEIELLTPEGQRLELERNQVQAVYLVTDFEATRTTAAATGARQAGVWVRVRGRDRSTIEGILESDLLELETGVWLLPLQAGGFYQRVYIPREAIAGLSVVEVVKPTRRRSGGRRRDNSQISLFTESAADTQ